MPTPRRNLKVDFLQSEVVMSHVSVYRKWRPKSFDELIGQERVTRTLQNAIRTNRVVHAYLFAGHRGTGKTTTARILAKCLNCVQGPTPTPDNVSPNSQAINGGYSVDVIEIDAASNRGIEEIRELRDRIRLAPTEGRYKVYIIDEAHMLTTEAANALLKTLEEMQPPRAREGSGLGVLHQPAEADDVGDHDRRQPAFGCLGHRPRRSCIRRAPLRRF